MVLLTIALEDEAVGWPQARGIQNLARLSSIRCHGHAELSAVRTGFPIDDIGLPGSASAIIAVACSDDEVGQAVAIHIAGSRDRITQLVAPRIALDNETSRGGELRCV